MHVNIPLEKLLQLLGVWAQDAKDSARIKFGAKADAVIVGVSHLFDYQRAELTGLQEYDLNPEPEHQLLLKAVQAFCDTWCAFSRELPPGNHERCKMCPLVMFTAETIEEVVRKIVPDMLPEKP